MRGLLLALTLLATAAVSPRAVANDSPAFDWQAWRYLPVQEGGRHKPFDTLAWETLRSLANRATINDPQTLQRLDATTFYLVTLLEWQGWDRPADQQLADGASWRAMYFRQHAADKWDRAPLLRVDYLELRSALGLPKDQKYVSPLVLNEAKIVSPETREERPFVSWAEGLARKAEDELTAFEQKAVELADRLWSYQDHRMGNRLELVPMPGNAQQQWLSVAGLMRTAFDDTSDPAGVLRKVKDALQRARAAYRAGAAADFNSASRDLLAVLRAQGPAVGAYPTQGNIDLEVAYNHWVPFRFAWVLMMLAFLAMLLYMGVGWRPFHAAAWVAFGGGLLAISIGFAMRVLISGRAPVTNMYESVVYLALGVSLFGGIFELIYRRHFILTAAAALATVALILADNCPAVLDPSLQPLQPVLRSNFWLVTHVMTITLSYAAFALALGVGNITLGYFLVGSTNDRAVAALTKFTYRLLQAGVLLLAVGTVLGGVWADYSWGRFWGWDPKEVWALIALLGYLAVLHARYVGWVREFGLAALAVLCFALVVMAWYGVNFVLGAGLHSYGFGGGGQSYVLTAIALQTLYVLAAAIRRATSERPFDAPWVSAASQ